MTAAAPADAAPRPFTFTVTSGALTIGAPEPLVGQALPTTGGSIAGTVGDDGAITGDKAGVVFPAVEIPSLGTASLIATKAPTGSFNDATGAASLDLDIKIGLAGPGFSAGCSIGTDADPIRVKLRTSGATPAMPAVDPPLPAVTAAPLDWATGTLTLADPAIALRPAAPSCTTSPFTKATLDSVLSGAPVNNQAALGLAGKMAIDKLPAPTTDEPQPVQQPPVEPQPTFVASQGPSLAGPATITFPKSSKQRGLKSGGAVMTLTADRASDLVITPTVSIPGAGKTKLKALRRTVAAGKSTIAIKFPAALRKKALKALKARKTITVTTSTVATAVGSAAPVTITNTIKLSR